MRCLLVSWLFVMSAVAFLNRTNISAAVFKSDVNPAASSENRKPNLDLWEIQESGNKGIGIFLI
jgi:hypothetical protein